MKQTICAPTGVPTAFIALNKSRIKVYHKETNPTYYLAKGTEFMIELFNPTTDVVLAKVHLNGTAIAQGGLVLKPGQRVFLERYIDVAKKFLFDTYEVNNTSEVRKAIAENGDLKVEFYRESKPTFNQPVIDYVNHYHYHYDNTYRPYYSPYYNPLWCGSGTINCSNGMSTITTTGTAIAGSAGSSYTCDGSTSAFNSSSTYTSSIGASAGDSNVTMDSLSDDQPVRKRILKSMAMGNVLRSKSIETGRVEAGSSSNQQFEYVSKSFDSYAFHTVEYKMLPLSQKVNTTQDLNIKRYCTSCGSKQKEGYKFCPNCGAKA